jgi:hypothetical protein
MGREIQLAHKWTLGDRLDGGGFGQVFYASSPDVDVDAVAKLVPKQPGAERELLFVELGDARNVVRVIDSGETDDEYVLVMPRAEKSLRRHLVEHGKLTEPEAVAVLRDVAAALEDLDGRVVHRDLKPDNVLYLDGHWCLVDFGISRYAEATTALETRKDALTAPYAAPEQWRLERATARTDIYAMGVMAFEMLSGGRPFVGPDLRQQHLFEPPPQLEGVSVPLAALVLECLQKSPEARPPANDLGRRLAATGGPPRSAGLARLQRAHQSAVSERVSEQGQALQAETAKERIDRLFEDARRSYSAIGDQLRDELVSAAPVIVPTAGHHDLWALQLGDATLRLYRPVPNERPRSGGFEVIAFGELRLEGPGTHGYRGRSHSLWYCDAEEAGRFSWYETAFMDSPLTGGNSSIRPFALPPDEGAIAFSPVMGTKQLARSLRRLIPGRVDDFINEWADRLGAAYEGRLSAPSRMPEEDIQKNYRGAS